jgi:hypothetical protein
MWAKLRLIPDIYWQRLENKLSSGWPDTLALLPEDRCVFIELKGDASEGLPYLGLRKEQRLWLRRWIRAGGNGLVLRRAKKLFEVCDGINFTTLASSEDVEHVCGLEPLNRLLSSREYLSLFPKNGR